jgi:hypothetical protein
MMVNSRKTTDVKTEGQGAGGRATRVLILPAGGVMERDMDLNQTQASNGANMELEKMELGTKGARIFTRFLPEDYDPEQDPPEFIETDAEYRVDDGNWKPAFRTEFGTALLEDGVRYIWGLDPVPLGTRDLNFRINRIGDWKGPWEFEVPLN